MFVDVPREKLMTNDLPYLHSSTCFPLKSSQQGSRESLLSCGPKATTAASLWEQLDAECATMTTGSSSLDELLQGGFVCGEITEIIGPSASGKTQLCMNAVVAAVVHCGKHALVLDTGSCLAASRMTEMMGNRGVPKADIASLLDGIRSFKVSNIFDTLNIIAFALSKVKRDRISLERPPRDGIGLERPPRDGTGLERPPRDGTGLERPPRDGAGLECPPREGIGLERPPRDGTGLERPSREGTGLECPPRDGAGLERPPREGIDLERPPRDGAGLERPLEDLWYGRLKLLIVDCVYDLIAPILTSHQIEGHALMCEFSQGLRRLAHVYRASIVVTNCAQYVGGTRDVKPALGKTWSHVPAVRIALSNKTSSKGQSERELKILKSNGIRSMESMSFTITERGIT